MKSLLYTIFAVVTLSGCATFGVNTAPESPVPAFTSEAFPLEFSDSAPLSEISLADVHDNFICCSKALAGACEVKFDELVLDGHAKVFYYRDWNAHIAVLKQIRAAHSPESIALRLRADLTKKGMLVPPVETGEFKGHTTVLTYSGERDGTRIVGKMVAFYVSDALDKTLILYGEWSERTNTQMNANFSRIAMELGLPQDLD